MKEKINILVAEDDADINNLLYKILSKNGYNVRCAYSGSEAKMCFEQYEFQLVLLDLMLPGVTGEELITHIRKINTVPIIVISAKPGQDIKIDVLKLGADDFVPKPFDAYEVLARVEAQLRRYIVFSNNNEKANVLKHKNLTLNSETLMVEAKGQAISLTAREFSILQILMSYPNKVFTKANLFEHAWNAEFLGDDNTVNVHVSNLRSKIAKADPDEEYIHTVWGIGFKMSEK
ncbi:response regulator transcription factor [Clostridium sp. PL3]|uniref:Response regulator transcription factor n=1 Tax=Clostridium thailandense TaxID=2794346 RepID=A0A949TQ50_9CLOT|nr:response regulator transcription factor [Clostridium thailandense]MBV7273357.1 response regulator transcription factor [Clostridium thailandense]